MTHCYKNWKGKGVWEEGGQRYEAFWGQDNLEAKAACCVGEG